MPQVSIRPAGDRLQGRGSPVSGLTRGLADFSVCRDGETVGAWFAGERDDRSGTSMI